MPTGCAQGAAARGERSALSPTLFAGLAVATALLGVAGMVIALAH